MAFSLAGAGRRLAALSLLAALSPFAGCGEDESTGPGPSTGPAPCQVDAECDDGNPCSIDACGDDGFCADTPAPDGEAPVQERGDCRRTFCAGGAADDQIDDGDVEDDGEPCTLDTCEAGVPDHVVQVDGAACQVGSGAGSCSDGACVVPCTPEDAHYQCDDLNECTEDGCLGEGGQGICEHSVYSGPTPGFPQVEGDCHEQRCIEGVDTDAIDDLDVFDDGNACTADTCKLGTPLNEPVAAGAECADGGGQVCDGLGECVQCLAAADCEGVFPGDCVTPTCNADHSCEPLYTPDGTPLPAASQQAGDCRTVVCNGNGGTTNEANASDLPDDGNACTIDSCQGTSGEHAPAPAGTPCDGGKECDGFGSCCTAATCEALGKNCGGFSNGCGKSLFCGDCAPGDTCGPAVTGVCGCTDGIQNGSETGVDCGGVCPNSCALGIPCAGPADCANGFCVDGFCCNSACGSACKACSQAKTGVANGTCADVLAGTDPDGDCTADAVSSCGQTGQCSAGACEIYPAGTVCAPGSCSNAMASAADLCNGSGTCVDGGAQACAAPYVCGGATCQSCSDGVKNGNETGIDCGGGGACAACGPGSPCNGPSDCANGQCVDGVCCTTSCAGVCRSCNLPGTQGTCSFLPAGSDPNSECPGQATCNGSGACN